MRQIQQQVLDPGTLLLEYSLGQDRGYLWAVTEALAQAASALSATLFGPVASQLKTNRVVIVADGAAIAYLRPAAALRAAQLSMRNDPKWKNPYYWAAFTLQGEWR